MVGCSGDPDTQTNTEAVAHAITADNDTSFLLSPGRHHLLGKGQRRDHRWL
jgi:hypothetical protein